MNDNTLVFHVPGRPGIIDIAWRCKDGIVRSDIQGETLEQIRARYPGAQQGELGTVAVESERLADVEYCKAPVKITREQYDYYLNVLPPMNQRGGPGAESFMLCEFTYGSVTTICARIANDYYKMVDHCTLSHDEIIAACRRVA